MYSDKKRSKEDTWKAADLKRYIVDGRHGDVARDERGNGDSMEKHKESRKERDKYRDYHSRNREDSEDLYRHTERKKEGSRDRREERERRERRDERDRREERDKREERENREDRDRREERLRREDRDRHKERRSERDRAGDLRTREYMEKTDRRKEREETRDRHRDREQHWEKDKIRDKYPDEERVKRREEREKEKRRDLEQRHDRDRHKRDNTGEGGSEYVDKYNRERRERHRERDHHKEEYEVRRSDKDRSERHMERKHSDHRKEKDHQDDRQRDKGDRERRHKEQGHHEEKRKHHSEYRDLRDHKGAMEKHNHSDQEAEKQRDKHRERGHREQKHSERKHEDKTREKDKGSEQTEDHTLKAEETKTVNDEDEVEPEYEDDFEEYEEDFEDVDESGEEGEEKQESEGDKEELTQQRKEEIKAIQRAMDEENQRFRALSRQNTQENEEDRPKGSRESERSQSKASHHGKFMDFVAAKQREVSKKVATKQKKRCTELLRLIDLDFTLTSSLLDLPPVNEYDMYIRNFGTANTKQAYVQCNEDNVDRDIQTEEIELCDKWTQHPPERDGACGDPNISTNAQELALSELNIDSKRLTKFLQSASQVMIVLLEEDQAERNSLKKMQTKADILSFTDGSLQLNTELPFLHGRHINLIHFSQVQKHTMISVHNPTTKASAEHLDKHTLICLWNIWEPSRPQKILIYESEVQCCCFSPGKATLVFAGTTVGSVVLWDLREHTSNHYHLTFGDEEWTFRQPSFSTDAVMSASGHFSTVVSVQVVPSVVARGQMSEVSFLASEEEVTGLSFQLASLDESGILNFWVVVELPKASEAGSQTDLGLRPGGKVKLLHSSSLSLADRISHKAKKTAPLQTLQLNFLPTDPNHFYIGTNMGIVHHGTSHGMKAFPKFYTYQHGGEKPVDINSVSFSPFRQDLFLVGCGDGCIRLHAVSQDQPLIEWTDGSAGQAVVSVQWSQTRPAVFTVLDAASNVHLWDLLKNETEAAITERMEKDRVTAMALFGDSGQQNTYSGVALAHESGKIDIQYFTKDFTLSCLAEMQKLNSLVNETF